MNKIGQFLEDHFHNKILWIGVAVIIVIALLIIQFKCRPDPVPNVNVNTNTTRSSSHYEKSDTAIKDRIINIKDSTPNSIEVNQPVNNIPKTRTVFITKHDTIKVSDIETDSCRAIELNQILPMEDGNGYYIITGIVSCKVNQVYNLRVVAHHITDINVIVHDTIIKNIIKDSVNYSHTKDSMTTIIKEAGGKYSVYMFGKYDPLISNSIEAGIGASLPISKIPIIGLLFRNLNSIDLTGEVLYQTMIREINNSGFKTYLGVKYYIFR